MDNMNEDKVIEEDVSAAEGNADQENAEGDAETTMNEEDLPEAEGSLTEDGQEETDKKALRKRAKADKKQDALKEKIAELEDRVMRQMAEFENFRKRTEKEKSQMFETGAKSVIEKILPVVDNFERGLATVPDNENNSSFAEGMNMIYKQLMNELESLDIKVIDTIGQEFNPDLHSAVMQVESDKYESGIIAEEMQKGYTYRDTVIRYSMVAVVS